MEAGGCAAGRARTGNCGEINTGLTKGNSGKFFQCRLEPVDSPLVSPFLWPKNGCGAPRTRQGIGDVAKNDQLRCCKAGVKAGEVDRCQVGELRGQVVQQLTITVSEPGTQGLKDAGAAVDGCGTAHSD